MSQPIPQLASERLGGSWALLPPHIPKEEVQPPGCKNLEAIEWFDRVLPQLRHKYGTGPDAELLEGIQEAGETIFVPPKWWHAVLNLDFTVAVPSSASRCLLSGRAAPGDTKLHLISELCRIVD